MDLLATIARSTPWAIEPSAMAALRSALRGVDLTAKMTDMEKAKAAFDGKQTVAVDLQGDTATIEIKGALSPDVPWWAHYFGLGMVDTGHVVTALQSVPISAAKVVLNVNSPGGSVAMIPEAAAAVRALRAAGKHVSVNCNGLLCSAAYWIASQANEIHASPAARVGCIGTYVVLSDTSKADAAEGVEYVLISSGGVKGLGADGRVSDAMKADYQKMVNGITALFVADVAAGRRMNAATAQDLATGAAHLGAEAVRLGLADTVTIRPQDSVSASQSIAGTSMKIIAATLVALIESHPAHANLVTARAKAGDDEAAILAAIRTADDTAKDAKITDLAAQLSAEKTAHAATRTALETEKAAHTKLRALANGAPADPGGSQAPEAGGSSDAAIAGEWASMTPEKRGAFLGDEKAFAFWVKSGRPQ